VLHDALDGYGAAFSLAALASVLAAGVLTSAARTGARDRLDAHDARTPQFTSAKAQTFEESVIREMSRLCAASGGVNLAQGFPDFACPQQLKDAAKQAIDDDVNQYAITWGAKAFRDGIAAKTARTYPGWTSIPRPSCASPAARPRR
jgi:aminotransferase